MTVRQAAASGGLIREGAAAVLFNISDPADAAKVAEILRVVVLLLTEINLAMALAGVDDGSPRAEPPPGGTVLPFRRRQTPPEYVP